MAVDATGVDETYGSRRNWSRRTRMLPFASTVIMAFRTMTHPHLAAIGHRFDDLV